MYVADRCDLIVAIIATLCSQPPTLRHDPDILKTIRIMGKEIIKGCASMDRVPRSGGIVDLIAQHLEPERLYNRPPPFKSAPIVAAILAYDTVPPGYGSIV